MPADFDPLVDEAPRRYVVGIDLGTTNSAVAYVDTLAQPWRVEPFPVPQLVAPQVVEARDTLPSFHYQAAPDELTAGGFDLPWHAPQRGDAAPRDWAVGVLAREEGLRRPNRLIASAKSWLCHAGVDRTAELLPWHGAEDVERLSPVTVTARFLDQMRAAWNDRFPAEPLEQQDLVVTLPASFDEVARELTVSAAAEAGLRRVWLIEEPQAAFYAWVHKFQHQWPRLVAAGQTILVCDIGGGTSDFTLIKVRSAAAAGHPNTTTHDTGDTGDTGDGGDGGDGGQPAVQFHRLAVGDHLILGGDNLDLALARHVEQRLTGGGRLPPEQWDLLLRNSRRAKETLLGPDAPEETTLNLPGKGARLVGGAAQVALRRDEVEQLLLEGFLPHVSIDAQPHKGQSGFRELGLPFAADPAMTRHLATFLRAHAAVDAENPPRPGLPAAARPDVILFNGGFFASPVLRKRILAVISDWFSTPHAPWQPQLLENDRLDLAVARGAAYYGMVRRGIGVRIAAGLARSYYIAVHEEHQPAEQTTTICLVPGQTQPGEHVHLHDRTFDLAVSQPVEFPLYVSSTRLTDQAGQLVPYDAEQMRPLPPIRTVLHTPGRRAQELLPVTLHAQLSEIGTIELWCAARDSDRTWRLQFDVRSATQTDLSAHQPQAEAEGFWDERSWERAQQVLLSVFEPAGSAAPAHLAKQLSQALGCPRDQWPTSLLRRIWDELIRSAAGRRKSPAHEARWLNLAGYALRPGYGMAVDDWRVATTWRLVQGKLAFPALSSQNECLILWRRIAGGLSAGQQRALAEPLVSALKMTHLISVQGKQPKTGPAVPLHQSVEAWRLIGSLEWLPVAEKQQLAEMTLDLVPKRKFEKLRDVMFWTVGRLGQRQPTYGPLNTVTPPAAAASWLERLMRLDLPPTPDLQLAVMQLAYRTEDRFRDMDATLRETAAAWLETGAAPDHMVSLVRAGGALEAEEQNRVFGEKLPIGLRLVTRS